MIAMLFTFYEKITLTEVTYLSKVFDHTSYQNLKVCGAVVAPTSHFCTSAFMDWSKLQCQFGVSSSGALLMSNFSGNWLAGSKVEGDSTIISKPTPPPPPLAF